MRDLRRKERQLILSEVELLDEEGRDSFRTLELTNRINERTGENISRQTVTNYVSRGIFDEIDFEKVEYEQEVHDWEWTWNRENYRSEAEDNSGENVERDL